MNISEALATTPVSELDLDRYVPVSVDASVAETTETMRAERRACALILDDRRLAGIFTQRDVLHRVIGRPSTWDRPVTEEMTTAVRSLREDQCVGDGLAIMADWWVRNVPVLDGGEQVVGNLSYYVLIRHIGQQLTARFGEESLEPGAAHGLNFVDFTGLNFSSPVMVGVDDTAETAAHHMKARGIGSVLVVDDRHHLVGVLTEFDLLTKIGCQTADTSSIDVGDIMTTEPVVLAVRSSIADAIGQLVEHEFSHIPLVGESGRPVGVASFRDLAAYVETSLAAMA